MKRTDLSLLLRNGVWLPLLVVLLVLSGCCPSSYQRSDRMAHLLQSYPISTFVDSSGNYLQLIFTDTSYRAEPSYEYEECESHYLVTHFILHGHHQGELAEYEQKTRRIHLLGLSVQVVSPGTYGDILFDSSLTIQGFPYNNCWFGKETDSSGNVLWELAIDRYYGIVLFSKRNEYRWERVLEW